MDVVIETIPVFVDTILNVTLVPTYIEEGVGNIIPKFVAWGET